MNHKQKLEVTNEGEKPPNSVIINHPPLEQEEEEVKQGIIPIQVQENLEMSETSSFEPFEDEQIEINPQKQ